MHDDILKPIESRLSSTIPHEGVVREQFLLLVVVHWMPEGA